MFFAILFLMVQACAGFSTGPPYAMCESFDTGHPESIPSTSTVKISLLKEDQAVTCYLPGQTYTGEFICIGINTMSRLTSSLVQWWSMEASVSLEFYYSLM